MSAYLAKFERLAERCEWSEAKKLYRLFDCLSGTALEFANKCAGRDSYDTLIKELGQRFDLKDTPLAARNNLYAMEQYEDETIEAFLQRVMTAATDGFGMSDKVLLQNVATEAFLRGCRFKEAAMTILNEGPTTIQAACQRIKTLVANKKAVYGSSRVSFQERQFTLEEKKRMSRLEKSVETLMMMRGSTPSPSRQYAPRSQDPGYWSGQYNVDNRGRTATRYPFQGRTGYSPSPNRMSNYGRPPSPNVSNYTNPPPVPGSYYTNPPHVPGSAYYVNQPPVTGSYGGQPCIRPPFYPPGPSMPTFQGYAGRDWPDTTQRGNYVPNYGPNRGQARSPSPGYSQGFPYQRPNYSPSAGTQRQGYSPNSANPQGYGYQNQRPGMFSGNKSTADRSPGPKPPDAPQHPAHAPVPDKQHLNSNGLSK